MNIGQKQNIGWAFQVKYVLKVKIDKIASKPHKKKEKTGEAPRKNGVLENEPKDKKLEIRNIAMPPLKQWTEEEKRPPGNERPAFGNQLSLLVSRKAQNNRLSASRRGRPCGKSRDPGSKSLSREARPERLLNVPLPTQAYAGERK